MPEKARPEELLPAPELPSFEEDADALAQALVGGGEDEHEPADMLSPLDVLTQDPVVVLLLKAEAVDVSQALVALRKHQDQPGSVLWRVLADLPGVDTNAVFAAAAEANGYRSAKITDNRPAKELVDAVMGLFPETVGKEMLRLGLLPYEFSVDPESKQHRLTLATHDPTREDIDRFVRRIPLSVDIRYAQADAVSARLARIAVPAKAAPVQEPAGKSRPAEPVHAAAEQPEPSFTLREAEPGVAKHTGVQRGAAEGLTHNIHSDTRPDADVEVEARIDPASTEGLSGDGFLDLDEPEARFNLPEEQPEPDEEERQAPAAPELPEAAAPQEDSTPVADSDAGAPPEVGAGEEDAAPNSAPVEQPNLDAIASKDRVVAMLLRREIVTPKHVQDAQLLQKAQKSKETLWRVLTQVSGVDREAVFAEAARVYAFPMAKLGDGKPDPEFARSVIDTFSEEKRKELFKLRILPFECDLEHQTGAIKLVFVTHDPTRPEVHRLMQQLKLERFELRYAPEAVVIAALHEAYPRRNEFLDRMNEDSMAFDLGTSFDEKNRLIDEDALEDEINRSSLINLFEATLVEAVRQGASDIHIYPNASKKIEIHFRIDGRLNHWHTEDKVHPEALLAVIKDNATNVDRFERDAAQDGFIQRWIDDALIRFRVSVLPIANASAEIRSESIVIRVLDDRKVITDLKRLGLMGNALERFDSAIRQPHGMVILTGPTGSGKSTTLVAALHQVVTPEVNVLTVEDPVEYIIPGVRQIKLNHKLGLEEALRSILRHDPDVVMVGEMRDRQTAELAIKLANTGHLTFSTLHTNDAPAAVSRLYKMGIEPFLIAYAINLVVAQRLIRTLCPECKKVDDDPDPVMLKKLGFTDEEINTTTIYTPGNNQHCKTCKGTGYKGRRAVTEALYFSRAIRHLIVESTKMVDEGAILEQAKKEGMLTLADSAREFVKLGDTSIMEMVRVVTTES